MKKRYNLIRILITTIISASISGTIIVNFKDRIIKEEEKKINKFKSYYSLLNQWLLIKNEGKSIDLYFHDNNYKTVAIYGMGEIGCRLYEDIKKTDIDIKYAIDKEAGYTYLELNVLDMEEELKEVDVIVITAIYAFDEIKASLKSKVDCPIISVEDIIFSI